MILFINSGKLPMKTMIRTLAMLITVSLLPLIVQAEGEMAVQAIGDIERKALFPSRNMIDLGRTAALANCAGCHGMDGISNAEGKPHLAGQRTVYLYRALKGFQSGKRPDKSNNHNHFLNDEALLSAAIFYANLPPATHVESADSGSPEKLAEAKKTTEADETPDAAGTGDLDEASGEMADDAFFSIRAPMKKCIKCHDESGNASGSGMPRLTAQDPEYFVTAMMAYVDGSRNHKLMKKLVSDLDESTIREMGVYYAVQEPLRSETQGEGDINTGRRLSEECAGCHGNNGNAENPSMPSIAGQDAKYFIKAMTHYQDGTRQHKKMFEAVEALSEQEMIDLATYYANQEPRRRNVRAPLKASEWITRCERCHGLDGNSTDPRFPMLAGQDEIYLKTALKGFATAAREDTAMYAMAASLSARDIERISEYFASQQPKAVIYMQLPCGNDQ
jgi:cytochrome c553